MSTFSSFSGLPVPPRPRAHVDLAGAPVEPGRPFVQVSDLTAAILHLLARHDGIGAGELVTRLICRHAESVGMPALLDAVDRPPRAGGVW